VVVRDGRDFFNYFIILRNIQRFYIGGEIGKVVKMALSCTIGFLAGFWQVFVGSFWQVFVGSFWQVFVGSFCQVFVGVFGYLLLLMVFT